MIIKAVGFLGFIAVVIYTKMFYSMGWFDGPSLLIVLGGSCIVWLAFLLLKKKWNLIAKNISVLFGLAYCLIWGIQILTSYGTKHLYIALVPLGYGLAVGILSEYIYNSREKKNAGAIAKS